jgi:hypothetical protein
MIFNDRLMLPSASSSWASSSLSSRHQRASGYMVAANRKAPKVNESPYVEHAVDTVTA